MKNAKRFIAALATFAITLSFVVSNSALVSAGTFSDVPSSSPFYTYIENLASAGVVSGDRGVYNPFGNATRGELSKMVVNASQFPINSSAGPSFADVPSSNPFYNFVETAKVNAWVNGYADGTFRPNAQVTRAEAMKIIVNSLGIPTQSPSSPSFADVPRSNPFYQFVEGGRTAGLASPNAFYRPDALITRQEIAKLVSVAMEYTPGQEPVDTPVDSGNVVTVNISPSTPAAQTIPKNANNIVFLSVDITAGAVEDVEITSLNLSLLGLGSDDDFTAVKVFDGVKQLGSDKTFASEEDVARFNLAVEPIVVPAGTTKTIDLRADLAGGAISNNENYFAIISPDDFEAFGATTGGSVDVTGAFPVVGNTMRLGNIEVAEITFEELSLSDKNAEIGEMEQVVTKFKLDVDGGAGDEDVLLQALTLEQKGSAKTDEVVNISLWVGNEQVGETIPTLDSRDQVTFDLSGLPDGGLLLRDGESRVFRVKADLIDGIGSTVYFELDEASDVVALGTTYGFGVSISDSPLFDDSSLVNNYVTIEGGDLAFAFFSVADTVSNDIEDYAFGTLRITNNGEPITIEDMTLYLNYSGAGASGTDITDVKFVGPNGTVSGPVDPSNAASPVEMSFPDDFDVAAGTTVEYTLQADIEQEAPAGAEYYFTLDLSTNAPSTEGITSGDNDAADITPSSNITTQAQVIEIAGLTVTSIAQASDSLVADTDSAEFIRVSLRAGDSEAVTITDLSFDVTAAAGASIDDLQSAAVYVSYDGGQTEILKEGNVNPDGSTIAFNDLDEDGFAGIALAAGEEAVVIVRADVAGDLTANNGTIQLALGTGSITAEDSDFDQISEVNGNTANGPTLTLVDSGELIINSTSRTADEALYVAGASNVEFAAFTIEGEHEKVDIDDLTLTITGGFSNDGGASWNSRTVDSVSLWYEDGSPVKFDNGTNALLAGITQSGSDAGVVDFSDLNLIAEDGSEDVIIIKANLRTVGTDSNDTAVDGAAVSITIANKSDINAKGFSSGQSITGTALDFTSPVVEDMIVVGSYPVLTLAADSPTSFGTNTNEEVFRFTVTNPANESSSDLWIKAIAVATDLTVSSDADIEVSNYRMYDGSTSNKLLTTCTDTSLGGVTANSGSAELAICNFENASGSGITNDVAGFEVANGDSESLVLRTDISGNVGTGINSIKFKIPYFGDSSSTLNTAESTVSGISTYDLLEAGTNTFAKGASNSHALIWLDEEGDTLLHYLDTESIDFSSNRLSNL